MEAALPRLFLLSRETYCPTISIHAVPNPRIIIQFFSYRDIRLAD